MKVESLASGGGQEDEWQKEADPNEDHFDARGYFIQNDTSDDESVHTSRDGSGNMTFKDVANSTPVTLTSLIAGAGGLTEESHKILRQLIHFINDGPAEGFASGAYREVTSPGITPDGFIWWESSSKLKKIVEVTYTWSGIQVTSEEWKIYDTDGSTVLATVTDSISYTGAFESNRTRTIVLP
jgi:hypothetical protein